MQTRKEIDRGDIKLAIDILADIDDPAAEHILGVLVDCGNEIARLRAENEVLKERERTNDTLLTEQGDKLAALNDELSELRAGNKALRLNLEASTIRLNESLYLQSRLKAENEALRKDAERYRILREQREWVVHKWSDDTEYSHEFLDVVIDAAMKGR